MSSTVADGYDPSHILRTLLQSDTQKRAETLRRLLGGQVLQQGMSKGRVACAQVSHSVPQLMRCPRADRCR